MFLPWKKKYPTSSAWEGALMPLEIYQMNNNMQNKNI
jgi:hypothetical protein